MIKGIDVSVYQGDIDWKKVKDSGIEFALIRVGYGWNNDNQKDKKFEQNYKGAKEVGMPIGIYHYSYAKTPQEAVYEAETVLKWIKGKQFEYPVYFDIEEQTTANTGKANCTAICKAFCQRLEKEGYFVGIYANTNWFKNYLDYTELSKLYTIWKADYRPNYDTTLACDIHQYSSSGSVNGINARVDMNTCTRDFSVIKANGYNGFSKSQPQQVEKTQTKPVFKPKHKVGEWVRYSTCYKSATDTVDKHLKQGGIAQIVEIVEFTQNYMKLSNGLFVNDGDIREVLSNKPQSNTFKNGDKVYIKEGAKDLNTNKKLADWVYKTVRIVMDIKNNRVCVGDGKNITAAIDINDIKKV